jgi:hypothetical protein
MVAGPRKPDAGRLPAGQKREAGAEALYPQGFDPGYGKPSAWRKTAFPLFIFFTC